MIRKQIRITEQQNEALAEICEETGLRPSEHIRRALDEYIAKWRKEKRAESENK